MDGLKGGEAKRVAIVEGALYGDERRAVGLRRH